MKQHNKAFEVPHPEEELVSFYFRLPDEMQTPAFYPTSVVLDIITRTSHLKNVSCVSLGRVLAMMGYESGVVKRPATIWSVVRTRKFMRCLMCWPTKDVMV